MKRLTFWIKQTFYNLNLGLFLIILFKITLLSYFMWILTLTLLNSSNFLNFIIDRTCIITAYINPSLKGDELISLQEKIKNLDKVKHIEFISKDQALAMLEEELNDKAYILDALSQNPLPSVFKIKIYDGLQSWNTLPKIATTLLGFKEIDSIKFKFPEDFISNLQRIFDIIKSAGGLIILMYIILYLLTLGIINFLLLSKNDKNIKLLQLLGASNTFITLPYIIQMVVICSIAMLISLGFSYITYNFFINKFLYISLILSDFIFIPINLLIFSFILVIIINVLFSLGFIKLKLSKI
jgi:cell division transport system permease protein